MPRGGARATSGKGDWSSRIRAYYRTTNEWGRLTQDAYHRLELETTLWVLKRFLPRRGWILDAGGGPGRYTLELARRGYHVSLLDFTPEALNQARRHLGHGRIAGKVREYLEGTIVDLHTLGSGSFDGVVCLGGPLNHVLTARQRRTAVRELARVAKAGAPIVISVIGRLNPLEDGLVRHPDGVLSDSGHHRRILRTGDYDGHRGFAPCHFFTPEELERLLRGAGLQVVELAGLEGIAAHHPRELNRLVRSHPRGWEVWIRFHQETCRIPAVVATSEHFIAVTRKQPTRSLPDRSRKARP